MLAIRSLPPENPLLSNVSGVCAPQAALGTSTAVTATEGTTPKWTGGETKTPSFTSSLDHMPNSLNGNHMYHSQTIYPV